MYYYVGQHESEDTIAATRELPDIASTMRITEIGYRNKKKPNWMQRTKINLRINKSFLGLTCTHVDMT